jgi:radical SAM-linked protein
VELPPEVGTERSERPERPGAETVVPPRQRWRLVVARSADAPRLAGRELVDAWEEAIEASGLPVHRPAGRVRTRVAFGAPIPLGIAAERELVEIHLAERVPIWCVRAALADRLPTGWRLVDLHDVWTGAPALAGRVAAAEYRVELIDGGPLAEAAGDLLAAPTLPRSRTKGGSEVAYDLRPLLEDISIAEADGRSILRLRTRIHPELGTGRPEEVLAALGERLGRPLEPASIVRERLILADDTG